MAAPSEIYVDPAIAADSGTGTSGDPFGDFQYALNTVTRDATNGNRFNIKAGTAEVLTAITSLATYGSPTVNAPLLIEGYTSTAGDGGIGDFNGNAGNFSILPNTQFVAVRNMKLRNTGTATIVSWSSVNWNWFDNVEFNTCTNVTVVNLGSGCRAVNCSWTGFATASQILVTLSGDADVIHCWFESNGGLCCINIADADGSVVYGNIINCAGVTLGVRINSVRGNIVKHNSILGSSGTGSGIALVSTGADGSEITNNIIAGFSGAGGDGIDVASGSKIGIYGYNYFYNNTSDETGVSGAVYSSIGGNELAGASDPFARSGANTFANRGTYFAPNAVGSIRNGAYPTALRLDKGACQHADSAGGGTTGRQGLHSIEAGAV